MPAFFCGGRRNAGRPGSELQWPTTHGPEPLATIPPAAHAPDPLNKSRCLATSVPRSLGAVFSLPRPPPPGAAVPPMPSRPVLQRRRSGVQAASRLEALRTVRFMVLRGEESGHLTVLICGRQGLGTTGRSRGSHAARRPLGRGLGDATRDGATLPSPFRPVPLRFGPAGKHTLDTIRPHPMPYFGWA